MMGALHHALRHAVFFFFLINLSIRGSQADREHKIHNIVLYPEKESWCKTEPIKQVVAMPGYEPATIDNNVCVGACYSYSIPRTQPAEPGELIGPYCDSCQPVDTKCYHVTLQADKNNVQGPRTIQKRVQIIVKCSCMSCDKIENKDCEILDHSTSELPSDLFTNLNLTLHSGKAHDQKNKNEVPELLHLSTPQFYPAQLAPASDHSIGKSWNGSGQSWNHGNTFNNDNLNSGNLNGGNSSPATYELNANLIQLLKSIQNSDDEDEDESSNISYDREQLKELLDIIEGSEHELSDKNLMDFVNFVNVHNSEDIDVDLSKLKEVLTAFRKDQELLERHRNFGLGNRNPGSRIVGPGSLSPTLGSLNPSSSGVNSGGLEDTFKLNLLERGQENNADINRDIENLSQKYNIPKTYGAEGSHLNLGHYKGNHMAMGIVHHNPNNQHNNVHSTHTVHNNVHSNLNSLITGKNKNDQIVTGKGHHHLGDEQRIGSDMGHLERGPHGSLTFVPDNTKLKLNLSPDMVKPNHEGVVISYENEPDN